MSSHRYNRDQRRHQDGSAMSPASFHSGASSIGPLGVDWGNDAIGNGAPVSFGGIGGGRVTTPPELKGAGLRDFLRDNDLAGSPPPPRSNGNNNGHHHSNNNGGGGVNAHPITAILAAGGGIRGPPPPPTAIGPPTPTGHGNAFGFPSAPYSGTTNNNNGSSGRASFSTSPPPQQQQYGGMSSPQSTAQTFSGANILSSLAAATAASKLRAGTSPPSLMTNSSGNFSSAAGQQQQQQQQQSSAVNVLSLFQNAPVSSSANNTNNFSSAYQQQQLPTASGAASPMNVAHLFAAATAKSQQQQPQQQQQQQTAYGTGTPTSTGGTPAPQSSGGPMTAGAPNSTTTANNNKTVPSSSAAVPPPSVATGSKVGGQPANNSKVGTPTAPTAVPAPNNATKGQKGATPSSAPATKQQHATPTTAAATVTPLYSTVLQLPPQHEVYVYFPNAETLRQQLKLGTTATTAIVSATSGTPGTLMPPQGVSGLNPSSPSRGGGVGGGGFAASTPSTLASGASKFDCNLDANGIAKLFAGLTNVSTVAGGNVNNNSNSSASYPCAGYRVSKPYRPRLLPRVVPFGQHDSIPLGVSIAAAEGVGVLFINEAVDESAQGDTNEDAFVAADDPLMQSGGGLAAGDMGNANSVIAELIIHNAQTISAVRPIDTKARNIHAYLNAIRKEAGENKTRGPNVMIVGNTDTGKSTLANYLVNAHLKEATASYIQFKLARSKARADASSTPPTLTAGAAAATPFGATPLSASAIAAASPATLGRAGGVGVGAAAAVPRPLLAQIQLIDLDVGQQGGSLPGCVSAMTISRLTKDRKHVGQSVFYGETSVSGEKDKKLYLRAVESLLQTVDNNQSIDRSEDGRRLNFYPVANGRIINTMGYTVDLGFELLVELVGLCKVDTIVVTGNNSDLKYRLQDALQKRYGAASRAPQSTSAQCNKHVAQYFKMPTFLLYNAPDCPVTTHGDRRNKRENKIKDYLRAMRFGEAAVFGTGSNRGDDGTASTPSYFATPATMRLAAASPATQQQQQAYNPYAFPSSVVGTANAAGAAATGGAPNPQRQLIHRVPLSRLDIRDAKTFTPITGQAFLKMGTRKLAAIPVPTYNEIANTTNAYTGKNYFPMLEPAVADEVKPSVAVVGGKSNPSSPNNTNNNTASPTTQFPNAAKSELDHLLLPNARGVVAFVGMVGLTQSSDAVDLIFDPVYVEEQLRRMNVLKGATDYGFIKPALPPPGSSPSTITVTSTKTNTTSSSQATSASSQQHPPAVNAPAATVRSFLSAGDYSAGRIVLLLSNIPLPEDVMQIIQ